MRISTRVNRVLWRHAASLIAIAALAVQTLFPHVHPSHASRSVFPTAVGRCIADCAAPSLSAAAPDSSRDTDQHGGASCPLCRAQRDARASILPSGTVVPFVDVGQLARVAASTAPPTVAPLSLAAPRAPPVVS